MLRIFHVSLEDNLDMPSQDASLLILRGGLLQAHLLTHTLFPSSHRSPRSRFSPPRSRSLHSRFLFHCCLPIEASAKERAEIRQTGLAQLSGTRSKRVGGSQGSVENVTWKVSTDWKFHWWNFILLHGLRLLRGKSGFLKILFITITYVFFGAILATVLRTSSCCRFWWKGSRAHVAYAKITFYSNIASAEAKNKNHYQTTENRSGNLR